MLVRLFRLMDLRTRYTHVFSALDSGRSASWAKLVMGETRGFRSKHVSMTKLLLKLMSKNASFHTPNKCELRLILY